MEVVYRTRDIYQIEEKFISHGNIILINSNIGELIGLYDEGGRLCFKTHFNFPFKEGSVTTKILTLKFINPFLKEKESFTFHSRKHFQGKCHARNFTFK